MIERTDNYIGHGDCKMQRIVQKHKYVIAVFLTSVVTLSIKAENQSNNGFSLTSGMLTKATKPSSAKLAAVHKASWGLKWHCIYFETNAADVPFTKSSLWHDFDLKTS